MKNKTWKFAIICSLIVMGFTACDDDDEYYYVGGGSSWLSYGNLEKIDNGSRSKFAIRRDDGNRLIVTEGMPINFTTSRTCSSGSTAAKTQIRRALASALRSAARSLPRRTAPSAPRTPAKAARCSRCGFIKAWFISISNKIFSLKGVL